AARMQAQPSRIHSSTAPRCQQRPAAVTRTPCGSHRARPTMLWPEAGRSPSVGSPGATPTPSTDTQATRPPASRRRSRNRGHAYDALAEGGAVTHRGTTWRHADALDRHPGAPTPGLTEAVEEPRPRVGAESGERPGGDHHGERLGRHGGQRLRQGFEDVTAN